MVGHTMEVYRRCMARTNIDIDEEACALVMRQRGFTTKRDAVNYALRRTVIVPMTLDEIKAMRGAIPDLIDVEAEEFDDDYAARVQGAQAGVGAGR